LRIPTIATLEPPSSRASGARMRPGRALGGHTPANAVGYGQLRPSGSVLFNRVLAGTAPAAPMLHAANGGDPPAA